MLLPSLLFGAHGSRLDQMDGLEQQEGSLVKHKGATLACKMALIGGTALAKKHPSLGRLHDARGELADYFGWVTVVDPVTKAVPALLSEWKWSGADGMDTAMMKQYCGLKFASIDWFNGTNGINALTAWRRSQVHCCNRCCCTC